MKTLYTLIDEILWNDWDPIGVNELPELRDEYQSYVPQLVELKTRGADKETIARRLLSIEEKQMGLVGSAAHCALIANKIFEISA